jgi:LacI family transcriptional regulator
MSNITMKDIAHAMSVDPATVSRALNGQIGVSDAVRKAIKFRAEEMGYRPNALARRLVTNRGNTIAYMPPDLANPFHVEVARAIKYYFRSYGYTLLICDAEWDLEYEMAYLDYLEHNRIDGLIIKSASGDTAHIAKKISCPVTLLSTEYSDIFPSIDSDNFYGGFLATEALLRCGYRRIAYLGAKQDRVTSRQREAGYRVALLHHGLPYRKTDVREGDFSMKAGRDLMQQLWKRRTRPDAVFCINDDTAIGAMDFIHDAGVRVPDDFGIIGFDNMALTSLSQIQMSTVVQQGTALGTGAAELLHNVIRGRPGGRSPERRIIEPRLLLRKTTRTISSYQPTPASKIIRPLD